MKRIIQALPTDDNDQTIFVFWWKENFTDKRVELWPRTLIDHFKIENEKFYILEIKIGTSYHFTFDIIREVNYYIYETASKKQIGYVHKEDFRKMFFTPKEGVRYDIVVKEIENE